MEKINKKIYSYSVFYEADQGEGGYVVSVPALPGCYSQGDTLEEAEANIKEAIELYLESLSAENEPIPEETRVFQGMVSVAFA
jgi:predicted RNase H-like HicB family nuclease